MIDQLIESLWWFFGIAMLYGLSWYMSKKDEIENIESTSKYKFINYCTRYSFLALASCYIIRPWL